MESQGEKVAVAYFDALAGPSDGSRGGVGHGVL